MQSAGIAQVGRMLPLLPYYQSCCGMELTIILPTLSYFNFHEASTVEHSAHVTLCAISIFTPGVTCIITDLYEKSTY